MNIRFSKVSMIKGTLCDIHTKSTKEKWIHEFYGESVGLHFHILFINFDIKSFINHKIPMGSIHEHINI